MMLEDARGEVSFRHRITKCWAQKRAQPTGLCPWNEISNLWFNLMNLLLQGLDGAH